MKEFFKITKFKLIAATIIFLASFAVEYILFKIGHSIFRVIFWPVWELQNFIGNVFSLGHTICPFVPPCFTVYPLWLTILIFVIILYLYSGIIEFLRT